jgi:hypothetical protein
MAEGVHIPQLHHALGQQAQRPALLAGGRRTTSQGDQVRFPRPVQLEHARAPRGPGGERRRDTLRHAELAHPAHRALADVEGRADLLVLPAWAARAHVRFEQDAGVRELACGSFARTRQILQHRALLIRQRDHILLVHGGSSPYKHNLCGQDATSTGQLSTDKLLK